MQLFLALILSGTALIVGLCAQSDWKSYSSPERAAVSFPDDTHSATILTETDTGRLFANLARQTVAEFKAAEKPFDRIATMRHTEGKMAESAGAVAAARAEHTFAFLEPDAVKMKFDFSEGSFELMGKRLSKKNLAKVEKFVTALNIPGLIERELRNEIVRAQREARNESREAKRDLEDESNSANCPDRAEADSRRERTQNVRSNRSESDDRTNH